MVKPGRIAKADRVGGGKQPEGGVRRDYPALVEQGKTARGFEHPLDDEHHVRTAGIVFIEHQRHIVLIGPGQNAVAEFRDLHPVAHDDGILADQVETADMAVEVDPHARPVEPRSGLFDMGRFAGPMIAGNDDTAVVLETGKDRQRRCLVEQIVRVHFRHMLGALLVGGHHDVRIDIEGLLHRQFGIRHSFAHPRRLPMRLFPCPACRPSEHVLTVPAAHKPWPNQ